MTMYGIWPSHLEYTSGEAPYMAGEATWEEAVDSICHPESALVDSKNAFVTTKIGDEWVPLTFLNAKTRKATGVNESQSKKYLNKRNRNDPKNEVNLPEDPPEVTAETEGDLVLRVKPHVAELLRDAFTLVAAGRTVTIQPLQQ